MRLCVCGRRVWHAGAESRSVNMTELMQTAAVMHSKLWIVDDSHLFIGSANMDYRSVCGMVATLAEYCHHRVCLSVCLSVRDHISATTRPISSPFLCMLPMSVAWSTSGSVAIRCVLPV